MPTERIWELMSKKLSNEASAAELKELEALLKSHPSLNYSMQIITDLWHQTPPGENDAHEAFLRHMEKLDQTLSNEKEPEKLYENRRLRKTNKITVASWLAVGLIIILLPAAFSYWWLTRKGTALQPAIRTTEVWVSNGSKKNIILPDGSKVRLNAGSRLTYPNSFNSKLREVSFSGEGYFEIVKHPNQPFLIHTNQSDIKVLGTAFNVRSYPGEKTSETSLIQGSIEVVLKGHTPRRIVLKPAEKMVIAANNVTNSDTETSNTKRADIAEPVVTIQQIKYEGADSSILETSWTKNKLVFTSKRMDDLAAEMERWYGVHISFDTEKLKDKKFTGSFTKETITEALNALAFTTPFHYTIKDKEIRITE